MHQKTNFYATVTVGTKGQIVIPIDAREELGIKTGDKLVVFGLPHHKMLGICSIESVELLLGDLTEKLNRIRGIVNKSRKAL